MILETLLSHPSYSHRVQTDDERSSREHGVFFFKAIQRAEASSMPPPGSARHPPPTTAGLFEAVTKLVARTKVIAGATPKGGSNVSYYLRIPTLRRKD
jgi:hypothetical protein